MYKMHAYYTSSLENYVYWNWTNQILLTQFHAIYQKKYCGGIYCKLCAKQENLGGVSPCTTVGDF